MTAPRIMVAMSGGVDSAVAAHLSSRQGDVAGVTMQLFDATTNDASQAAAVCGALGIPHFTADLSKEFRREVIDPFVDAYEQGLTPNPCIFCNRALKFGALLDFALAKGYDTLATGHYARIEQDGT